jgi:hypothetical protein
MKEKSMHELSRCNADSNVWFDLSMWTDETIAVTSGSREIEEGTVKFIVSPRDLWPKWRHLNSENPEEIICT